MAVAEKSAVPNVKLELPSRRLFISETAQKMPRFLYEIVGNVAAAGSYDMAARLRRDAEIKQALRGFADVDEQTPMRFKVYNTVVLNKNKVHAGWLNVDFAWGQGEDWCAKLEIDEQRRPLPERIIGHLGAITNELGWARGREVVDLDPIIADQPDASVLIFARTSVADVPPRITQAAPALASASVA